MSIFVMGMHRSGTSLVARFLALLGCYVGEPAELLPAAADNPSGFWERLDVIGVNTGLLAANGCNWDHTALWPLARKPAAVDLTGMELVLARLRRRGLWAVKDPRLCLTLPYWLELEPNPVVVLVHRDPAAISVSLEARNKLSAEHTLALWEYHVAEALRAGRGLRRIHVSFEAAVGDPVATMSRLRDELDLVGLLTPRTVNTEAAQSFVHAQRPGRTPRLRLTSRQHRLAAAMLGNPSGRPQGVSAQARLTMKSITPRPGTAAWAAMKKEAASTGQVCADG